MTNRLKTFCELRKEKICIYTFHIFITVKKSRVALWARHIERVVEVIDKCIQNFWINPTGKRIFGRLSQTFKMILNRV